MELFQAYKVCVTLDLLPEDSKWGTASTGHGQVSGVCTSCHSASDLAWRGLTSVDPEPFSKNRQGHRFGLVSFSQVNEPLEEPHTFLPALGNSSQGTLRHQARCTQWAGGSCKTKPVLGSSCVQQSASQATIPWSHWLPSVSSPFQHSRLLDWRFKQVQLAYHSAYQRSATETKSLAISNTRNHGFVPV